MYKIKIYLSKIKILRGVYMKLVQICPFVRYVHFLNIDEKRSFGKSVAFDNRLFYLLSASAKIAAGERIYSLSEGDVIIIPAGVNYELLTSKNTARYIAVNFDYTQSNIDKDTPVPPIFTENTSEVVCFESLDFKDAPELNGVLYLKGVNKISSKLFKLEKEYSARLIGFNNVTSGILNGIIVECIRARRSPRLGKSERAITDLLEYIEGNFSSAITSESIAEVFALHPNYLSALIKCYTGMPLHSYIMHVRVSHAMEMLGSGEYTVSEVAQKCGFADIYHFSKVFKRIAGVSPSKYSYIM